MSPIEGYEKARGDRPGEAPGRSRSPILRAIFESDEVFRG